jgi:hypothetical protein
MPRILGLHALPPCGEGRGVESVMVVAAAKHVALNMLLAIPSMEPPNAPEIHHPRPKPDELLAARRRARFQAAFCSMDGILRPTTSRTRSKRKTDGPAAALEHYAFRLNVVAEREPLRHWQPLRRCCRRCGRRARVSKTLLDRGEASKAFRQKGAIRA